MNIELKRKLYGKIYGTWKKFNIQNYVPVKNHICDPEIVS